MADLEVNSPACLLCGKPPTGVLFSIPVVEIVRRWQRELNIDVTDELPPGGVIERFECRHCAYSYFDPHLAGSPRLYENLQREAGEWYYIEDKWEYREALNDIATMRGSVLEVGCGSGDFIHRLRLKKINAVGIEQNELALQNADARGLPVYPSTLTDLLQQSVRFDVIAAFQVLEHVPSPLDFLHQMVALLRPGGYLLIGVPNCDGYLRRDPANLLNLPPHHISWFTPLTFRQIETELSLRVSGIRLEPLAVQHVEHFVRTMAPGIPRLGVRIACKVLRATKIYRRFPGHTMYIRLERRPKPADV